MTIQFDEVNVTVQAGSICMFAYYQSRLITLYAGLDVIPDADQAAMESGIELESTGATAKFLQPFFAKRIEDGAFDDDAKSAVTLKRSDLTGF